MMQTVMRCVLAQGRAAARAGGGACRGQADQACLLPSPQHRGRRARPPHLHLLHKGGDGVGEHGVHAGRGRHVQLAALPQACRTQAAEWWGALS